MAKSKKQNNSLSFSLLLAEGQVSSSSPVHRETKTLMSKMAGADYTQTQQAGNLHKQELTPLCRSSETLSSHSQAETLRALVS